MGIPINLDYSWFLIFALLTWMLASSYYPGEFKGWTPLLYWVTGAATALLLFASVLLHELGHSFVALRFKISVRSITLFVFGGVAQIGTELPSARAEFYRHGPIVSLALAFMFSVMQPALAAIEPLLGVAKYLAYMNFVLVLFNLIPGFHDKIQLLDASSLWGKGAIDVEVDLKHKYGEEFQIAAIGPGRENQVLYACINHDFGRQAGRGGVGAVMGSKKLKAIVLHGTKTVPVADLEGYRKAGMALYKACKDAEGLAEWCTVMVLQ